MPRYYFDIREGDDFAPDEEGIELPSLKAVQEEAARSLADMARDSIRKADRAAYEMAIEVRNDHGPVLQVRLTYAIDRHRH